MSSAARAGPLSSAISMKVENGAGPARQGALPVAERGEDCVALRGGEAKRHQTLAAASFATL